MKILYQDVKRLCDQMLGNVSNMERELSDFKKKTQNFALSIQDATSEQAIALVEELMKIARDLRDAIERGAQTVKDGSEHLNQTERRRSTDIGRI